MASKEATRRTEQAHVVSTTPDVCLTPMGSEDVPVPYPIVASFVDAVRTVGSVLFKRKEAFHLDSRIGCVQGNEAGTSGGVVSGVNVGACRPLEGSPTVKAAGAEVVRHGDPMEMNCAGPEGPGNTKGKVVYLQTEKATPESSKAAAAPKAKLTDEDYERAAKELGAEKNAVKAVANVEATGDGFLPTGEAKGRFEGHFFHRLTGGKYGESHPTLSYPKWTTKHNKLGAAELARVGEAAALDQAAAWMSTSWGKFQIMGEYYEQAGFDTVESFVAAMGESEAKQLDAFVSFIKGDKTLSAAIKDKDWTAFAKKYNGPGYEKGKYHTKLKEEYERLEAEDAAAAKGKNGVTVRG